MPRILFAGASTRFPLGTRLTARRLEPSPGDVRALRDGFDLVYPPEPFRWLGGTVAAGSMCRHDAAMQAGRRLDREYWMLELSNRLLQWLRPGRDG